MSKEPEVIYVDSYKDIPDYEKRGLNHWLVGFSSLKENKVYLVKGVATKSTEEHEKYHIMKRHSTKPRTASRYVEDEIDAHLYAYNKTKQPTHIKERLQGIYWDISMLYDLTDKQACQVITRVMKRKDIPDTWKSDWVKALKG